MRPRLSSRGAWLPSTLLRLVPILTITTSIFACGDPDDSGPSSSTPRPLVMEVAAPPVHGQLPHVEGAVWVRGDTVVLQRHVSFDRRVTWRPLELVPDGRLTADFVFVTDTTGVARSGANDFTFVDLQAGTYRGLAASRDDLSGWAVRDGFLYHMVEEVTTSVSAESAEVHFFRIDVDDPDAEWTFLTTTSLPYTPTRFRPSLHTTDDGLVAITRYGFLTSVDGGQTWTRGPTSPPESGALGDLNEVVVTESGVVIVLQGFNTVASYDGGATYENIASNPGTDVRWDELERLPGDVLALPTPSLRSDDGGRTWTSYLDRDDFGRRGFLRGDDVYLSDTTGSPTLVARPDGVVEMLLARAPGEPAGGVMTFVPRESGEIVGVVGRQLVRYVPGEPSWRWERDWPRIGHLFDAGDGRLVVAVDTDGRDPATLWFSSDEGRTWGDEVLLRISGRTLGSVSRFLVLPDRLLAHGTEHLATCRGATIESLDGGATWSSLPLPEPLVGVESVGFFEHVPTGATSDGIVFGYSEQTFDCEVLERYPSRTDDAARTWNYIDLVTGVYSHYPVAVSNDDDPITFGNFRPEGASTTGLVAHAFRRDTERWVQLGEPRLGDRAVIDAFPQRVDAKVGPDDRLYVLTSGDGIVRTAEPLR